MLTPDLPGSCTEAWRGEHRADNMTVTPVPISYGQRMAIYSTLDKLSGSSLLHISPIRQNNLSDSGC